MNGIYLTQLEAWKVLLQMAKDQKRDDVASWIADRMIDENRRLKEPIKQEKAP